MGGLRHFTPIQQLSQFDNGRTNLLFLDKAAGHVNKNR